MTRWIKGFPKNLSRHHRPLPGSTPVTPSEPTEAEYKQCQQCGHRNRHVRPYPNPGSQSFCQPSCAKVRQMLNQKEVEK